MEKGEISSSPLPGLPMHSQFEGLRRQAAILRASLTTLAVFLARLAFAGMVILIPFSWRTVIEARRFPPIYKDYTDFMLTASDRLMLAALAFWAISLLLSPRRIRTGPPFISLPLAGLTTIAALSGISSVDPALSFYHALRLVLLGLMYIYIVNEVHSLTGMAIPVALQVLIQSIVGLVQFLGQHSLGLTQFGELALDPAWKGVSIVWSGRAVLLRAYGLSDHPNILGGCLAFGLILLLYAYLENRPTWRTPVTAVVGLGLCVLLLTFSRSAWLALIAGGAMFTLSLFRRSEAARLKELAALAAAGLILLLPFIWQYAPFLDARVNPAVPSMSTGENRSIVERDTLTRAANRIFIDHAVLGVGLGAFPLALRAAQPGLAFDYQPAHFALIEVAAETGIFGGLFYAILLLAPWIALWLNRHRFGADAATRALLVSSALLLAVMTVGFFDYYTWVLTPGRLWQWLGWGLWAAMYQGWLEAKRA